MKISRVMAVLTAMVFACEVAASAAPALPPTQNPRPHDGIVTFARDGQATFTNKNGTIVRRAFVDPGFVAGLSGDVIPSRADMLRRFFASLTSSGRPYKPNALVVVFQPGAEPSTDLVQVKPDQLAAMRKAGAEQIAVGRVSTPNYSNNATINRVFAELGADRVERLARHFDRSALTALHAEALGKGHVPILNVANAYRIHITNASVQRAVYALSRLPSIAYVSPDYYVTPMSAPPGVITNAALESARTRAARIAYEPQRIRTQGGSIVPHAIPSNYAVSASAQSLLNAPGVDAVKAYDEIEETFNQLPGTGEVIANVSLGDVTDTANTSDPCYSGYASAIGPTTELINGQHYINWPSMPLIPAYVVDSEGNASGSAEACGVDPSLGEIGLDFSVMAPLPHQLQRAGEIGGGYTDLLGIAPGAQYKLFVPQSGGATQSDIIETFIAAALSSPQPDVITASIGFGEDINGFPGRYLEDDVLTESAIATLVNARDLVICISANDGTRTYTPAAIGPDGGSAATNRIAESATPTNLNDIAFTTIPSADYDSGALDIGGTTLDDVFAEPLGDAASAAWSNQLTWPETRWTGFADFSSGFGTRVDLSAPADNVLALDHNYDGVNYYAYDSVSVGPNGGTSASAPETAAVAAVVMQVARLTGHAFTAPSAVHDFLKSTARSVPNVPQTDASVHIGPQVDLGNAVDTLLKRAGRFPSMGVPRVAIAQRRDEGNYDGTFLSDTIPASVDLAGPVTLESGSAVGSDRDQLAPITIAPDWEGLPAGTKFRLNPVNRPNAVLATTPFVRLLPARILQAAGLPLVSTNARTVELEYSARSGASSVATYFNLTFGPADANHEGGFAPEVAPVTNGSTMSVTYDLTGVRSPQNPKLVISEPGRMIPTFVSYAGSPLFHPSYTMTLSKLKGTVEVPVSALQGAGVYGVTVQYKTEVGAVSGSGSATGAIPDYTGFAFTRVVPGSSVKAEPVLLATDGTTFSHTLYPNYAQKYQVRWSVANVSGADGALLEIGPVAPSLYGPNYNTFNNPNGSIKDDNGVDSGSIYTQQLSGTSGTITLSGKSTLTPALYNQIRVIPTHGSQAVGEAGDASFIGMSGFVPPDGNDLLDFKLGNGGLGAVETFLGEGTDVLANNVYPVSTAGSFQPPILSGAGDVLYEFLGTVFSGNEQLVDAIYFPSLYGQNAAEQQLYPPQYGLVNLSLGLAPSNAPSWPFLPSVPPPTSSNWYSFPTTTTAYGTATSVSTAYNRQGNLALYSATLNSGPAYGEYFTTVSLPEPQSPSFPASGNPLGLKFGSLYDVTAAYDLTEPGGGKVLESGIGISVDQALNEGIVQAGVHNSICATALPTQISTVSLTNGAITSFSGGGYGKIESTTYDSSTHMLAAVDECGDFMLTNVVTHQNKVMSLPAGEVPLFLSADTKNHLFLLGNAVDPTYLSNNDVGSSVSVYDENGNLVKTIDGFEFYASSVPGYLELNETNRQMFLPEFTGTQIEPAKY